MPIRKGQPSRLWDENQISYTVPTAIKQRLTKKVNAFIKECRIFAVYGQDLSVWTNQLMNDLKGDSFHPGWTVTCFRNLNYISSEERKKVAKKTMEVLVKTGFPFGTENAHFEEYYRPPHLDKRLKVIKSTFWTFIPESNSLLINIPLHNILLSINENDWTKREIMFNNIIDMYFMPIATLLKPISKKYKEEIILKELCERTFSDTKQRCLKNIEHYEYEIAQRNSNNARDEKTLLEEKMTLLGLEALKKQSMIKIKNSIKNLSKLSFVKKVTLCEDIGEIEVDFGEVYIEKVFINKFYVRILADNRITVHARDKKRTLQGKIHPHAHNNGGTACFGTERGEFLQSLLRQNKIDKALIEINNWITKVEHDNRTAHAYWYWKAINAGLNPLQKKKYEVIPLNAEDHALNCPPTMEEAIAYVKTRVDKPWTEPENTEEEF